MAVVFLPFRETSFANPASVDLSVIPCTHPKADNRELLQVSHAAAAEHGRIYITTSDSDVVVLAAYAVAHLRESIDELWIRLCSGRTFRYLLSKFMTRNLPDSKNTKGRLIATNQTLKMFT